MRHALFILAVAALLGVAACGGGSSGGPGFVDTGTLVSVQGTLETRDGDATALGGVVVTCVETGEREVTDDQGGFRLRVPQHEPFHLDFHDPQWQDTGHRHDGEGEHRDPFPDGAEVDGGGVTLRPNGPQDWCDIELHLDGGEITECHVWWGAGDDRIRDGERQLDRDPLCEEVGAFGEIEITYDEGCLGIELEVDGFSGSASLDIYLADLDGTEVYVDTLLIDEEGVGHLELSWCEGDTLPFDADSPADLAGTYVVVYDEVGDVVFRGHLPHHHEDENGHHHHGWEDQDDGHQHGGGPGGGPHRGA